MKSAPRDGSRFVAGSHHRDYGWLWSDCRYFEDENHPDGGYFVLSGGGRATHWFRLPPPPKIKPVTRQRRRERTRMRMI